MFANKGGIVGTTRGGVVIIVIQFGIDFKAIDLNITFDDFDILCEVIAQSLLFFDGSCHQNHSYAPKRTLD